VLSYSVIGIFWITDTSVNMLSSKPSALKSFVLKTRKKYLFFKNSLISALDLQSGLTELSHASAAMLIVLAVGALRLPIRDTS